MSPLRGNVSRRVAVRDYLGNCWFRSPNPKFDAFILWRCISGFLPRHPKKMNMDSNTKAPKLGNSCFFPNAASLEFRQSSNIHGMQFQKRCNLSTCTNQNYQKLQPHLFWGGRKSINTDARYAVDEEAVEDIIDPSG